jgi:putative component of membrane protein insertase Oxa1/YidC/SpoIIIJ protein YidD
MADPPPNVVAPRGFDQSPNAVAPRGFDQPPNVVAPGAFELPGLAFSALARHEAPTVVPFVRGERAPASWPWWADPIALGALLVVVVYRAAVPVRWRRQCIYTPSCSAYGLAVLRRYGGVRGLRYIVARLRRCDGARFGGGRDDP